MNSLPVNYCGLANHGRGKHGPQIQDFSRQSIALSLSHSWVSIVLLNVRSFSGHPACPSPITNLQETVLNFSFGSEVFKRFAVYAHQSSHEKSLLSIVFLWLLEKSLRSSNFHQVRF